MMTTNVTQVVAEKTADSSGDWATVTLHVGVTRDKLRILVMQFYPDTRVSISLCALLTNGAPVELMCRSANLLFLSYRNRIGVLFVMIYIA